MSPTYAVRIDEEYAVEALVRSRAIGAWRYLRGSLKAICAIGLLMLLALGVYARLVVLIFPAALFLGLLALGPKFDYWWLRTRVRKHPTYQEVATISLGKNGISTDFPSSHSTVEWSRYPRALEFPDGILLFSAAWDYLWLPDRALSSGDPPQSRAACRALVSSYHVV